jgi:hypothetical protein
MKTPLLFFLEGCGLKLQPARRLFFRLQVVKIGYSRVDLETVHARFWSAMDQDAPESSFKKHI